MTPTRNRGELGVDLTPPWSQEGTSPFTKVVACMQSQSFYESSILHGNMTPQRKEGEARKAVSARLFPPCFWSRPTGNSAILPSAPVLHKTQEMSACMKGLPAVWHSFSVSKYIHSKYTTMFTTMLSVTLPQIFAIYSYLSCWNQCNKRCCITFWSSSWINIGVV